MLKNLRSSDGSVRQDSLPQEELDTPVIPQPVILEGVCPDALRGESLKIAAGWMGGPRKVLAGLHVDVSVLDKGADETLKVDDIRAIRKDTILRPFDGEVKVYIIAHAHKLNHNAQNALLRTLEEPPPFARFILLTKNAEMLSDTIRSRCAVQRLTVDSGERGADSERERAEAFVNALGNPWKRAEAAFSLEKLPRDALRGFLTALLGVLAQACVRDGAKPVYIKTIKTVSELLPALELNASAGSVCGVLAVEG
jgi:hypothetical protein